MKIYSHPIRVQAEDIDELNHVNNVRYFDYLQAAAMAHWYATVPNEISDAIRWVVKKHEIEYFKSAYFGDELIVKTWIEDFSGVISTRHYEIFKAEQLLVKAKTVWVSLDPISMKPKRVPIHLMTYFE